MLAVDFSDITWEVAPDDLKFNITSARLQAEAGVDPAKCLRVGLLPSDQRTPLAVLLPSLAQGIWATPAEGQSNAHDKCFHWSGVRSLHPEGAKIAIEAAVVGTNHLNESDFASAVNVAEALDRFINFIYDQNIYYWLLRDAGVEPVTASYPFDLLTAHRDLIYCLEDLQMGMVGEHRSVDRYL